MCLTRKANESALLGRTRVLTGPALPNVLLLTATPYHATGDLNVYVDAEAIYVDVEVTGRMVRRGGEQQHVGQGRL